MFPKQISVLSGLPEGMRRKMHCAWHHSPEEDCDSVGTGKGPRPRPLGAGRVGNQRRLLESSDASTLSTRMNSRRRGNILAERFTHTQSRSTRAWRVGEGALGSGRALILPRREAAGASSLTAKKEIRQPPSPPSGHMEGIRADPGGHKQPSDRRR